MLLLNEISLDVLERARAIKKGELDGKQERETLQAA